MGQLISRDDIQSTATWYFRDARFKSSAGYVYLWPSLDFPFRCHINMEHLDNDSRILIRKWIANMIPDTVIVDYVECNYRKYYGEHMSWDRSYEVVNAWSRFHFEDEHSLTMFKLAFLHLVRPITKHHPDHPEDEEWCGIHPEDKQEYYASTRNNP